MDATEATPAGSNAESAILDVLRAEPLAATELKRRIKAKLGLKENEYKAVLDGLLSQLKIHGRPKLGKNGRPTKTPSTYALGAPPPPPPPPLELAPDAVLRSLRDGPLLAAELQKRVKQVLPGLAGKDLSAVLADLVAAGKVYERRKRGKNGKPTKTVESYVLGGPPAADFIAPVLASWKEVHAEASAAGVKDEALITALLEALSAAGFSVPASGTAAAPVDDRADVLRGVQVLEAREGQGALIPMRKLREALRLNKARFDAAVLGLYAEDAVILHHHDYVGSLTEAERNELVLDRHGNYYVGVALRGES